MPCGVLFGLDVVAVAVFLAVFFAFAEVVAIAFALFSAFPEVIAIAFALFSALTVMEAHPGLFDRVNMLEHDQYDIVIFVDDFHGVLTYVEYDSAERTQIIGVYYDRLTYIPFQVFF